MEIRAQTMMEAWHQALRLILQEGRIFLDDKRRECHEISNLTVVVENPSSAVEGVRAMRSSKNWRYPSEEELANIMLNKDVGKIYDYLYGQRIFDFAGVLNQIDNYIIPTLQQRPNTRRAIITLLNPLKDLRVGNEHIVGITALHFRIVEGKLNVTTLIRTSGFFTGWPANLYQVSKLQEYICRALAIPPGTLTTTSLSAHLYTDSFTDIEEILGGELFEEPDRAAAV